MDRAVLVQADDSAVDTEAMFEVSVAHPEIAGVVAWVPLDRPDVAATLGLDPLAAVTPRTDGASVHDWYTLPRKIVVVSGYVVVWCTIDPQINHEARINHVKVTLIALVRES